jgi:hypothetical protein
MYVYYYNIFLQAHREVFEYLIEDFKTYKPLLSAVKNEYEMMLAYQRQVIRELEPLKVALNVVVIVLLCVFPALLKRIFEIIPLRCNN